MKKILSLFILLLLFSSVVFVNTPASDNGINIDPVNQICVPENLTY